MKAIKHSRIGKRNKERGLETTNEEPRLICHMERTLHNVELSSGEKDSFKEIGLIPYGTVWH